MTRDSRLPPKVLNINKSVNDVFFLKMTCSAPSNGSTWRFRKGATPKDTQWDTVVRCLDPLLSPTRISDKGQWCRVHGGRCHSWRLPWACGWAATRVLVPWIVRNESDESRLSQHAMEGTSSICPSNSHEAVLLSTYTGLMDDAYGTSLSILPQQLPTYSRMAVCTIVVLERFRGGPPRSSLCRSIGRRNCEAE